VLGELAAVYWRPTVLGTHGLTPHDLGDGRWGLIDSDIIAHAVENGAPSVPVDSTAIVTDDFIVPHFIADGTIQSVIEELSVYGSAGGRLNDWGVYEAFFHRPPGWGRTWRVRRDEVAMPSETGPDASTACTGMVVTYSDGAGTSKSVGPPGSGADVEYAELADTSPLNPAARLEGGKTRRRDGGVTSELGAVNIGVAALREANADSRRGSVSVIDTVQDDAGNTFPVSDVRACDTVLIVDEDPGMPPEEQPIVGTSYSHESLTANLELGLPAPSVEALLARLAARTIN